MTAAEETARAILAELQDALAARDLERVGRVFADEVVLFGTGAVNVDRDQAMAYVAQVLDQDGILRWTWDDVLVLVDAPDLLAFAVVGSVGLDDPQGNAIDGRDAFRLTCVAVREDERWVLRHFHGSVPQR